MCNRVLELEQSHSGASRLLGQCYQHGKGLEMCHCTAMGLLTTAFEVTEAAQGPHHTDTATALNILAGLHRAMGNHKAALPLLTRSVKIQETTLGPHHPDTALAISILSLLHRSKFYSYS